VHLPGIRQTLLELVCTRTRLKTVLVALIVGREYGKASLGELRPCSKVCGVSFAPQVGACLTNVCTVTYAATCVFIALRITGSFKSTFSPRRGFQELGDLGRKCCKLRRQFYILRDTFGVIRNSLLGVCTSGIAYCARQFLNVMKSYPS